MAIIIEGMDATGKSTLASTIASALNLRIQGSEGPAKSKEEIIQRIERYSNMTDTLFDRHPCVSQNIYNICHPAPLVINTQDFYTVNHTFIYCAPTDIPQVPKAHEDKHFIRLIDAAHHEIKRLYNMWAIDHAHIIYRMGDDPQRVIDSLAHIDHPGVQRPDLVRDIEQFHQRFDIAYSGPPRHLPLDLYEFRERFLHEEALEYATAPSLDKRFDALVDVTYVALGSAHLHGFDFYAGWQRVHAANMAKVRATSAADSLRNSTHDVVKPPGWSPPDLTDLCK